MRSMPRRYESVGRSLGDVHDGHPSATVGKVLAFIGPQQRHRPATSGPVPALGLRTSRSSKRQPLQRWTSPSGVRRAISSAFFFYSLCALFLFAGATQTEAQSLRTRPGPRAPRPAPFYSRLPPVSPAPSRAYPGPLPYGAGTITSTTPNASGNFGGPGTGGGGFGG